MRGQDQRRVPLPAALSPAERDFVLELRRLVDLAGLTFRALEVATSATAAQAGEPSFYSKSRWGRWLNGQAQPPRKAVRKLAEQLDAGGISASHLLGLWDDTFAPVPRTREPADAGLAVRQRPPDVGASQKAAPLAGPALTRADQAASRLASLVAQECSAELSDRVLHGWQPLVVSWQPSARQDCDPGSAHEAPAGDTGDVGPLARHVQLGGRLIILGPAGAGKTTLAALLMDELLRSRQPGGPVPVLIPAASMIPGEMVKSWLERTLADRYPSLRDTRAYGARAISDLVGQQRILPVLDGLDELSPGARGQLLSATSRALGVRQPLILTCRPDEYHEGVAASGRVLPGGAIIALQPVAAEAAAGFLERGTAGPRAAGWHHVAAALRSEPAGPLARALSSPLMVSLVRSSGTDGGDIAAGLGGQGDQAAIEHQILQGLVDAAFSSRATSQNARQQLPWSAPAASRWLACLAGHMAWLGTYDLDWLRLRYMLPAFTSPLRRAVLSAALAAVAAGAVFALSRGLSFGAYQGLLYGLAHGLDIFLVVGSLYLLAPLEYPPGVTWPPWLLRLRHMTRTPLRTTLAIPAAYALESGIRDGIGAGRIHGIAPGLKEGLIAAALNWLVAAVLLWLAARAKLFKLAEKPGYFSLRMPGRAREFARTMVIGLAWGAGLGLVIGYGVKILGSVLALEHPVWLLGVPAGAVIGLAFALVQWGRTPVASAPAASPLSALRADRNLVLVLAVPFLIVLPVFFGTAFVPGSGLDHFSYYLYGLGIGLAIWLALALCHAWPQYLITAACLAARRKLPWRLAAFLSAVYDLEILRQRGDVYLFRHSRLQDHLAGTAPVFPGEPHPAGNQLSASKRRAAMRP